MRAPGVVALTPALDHDPSFGKEKLGTSPDRFHLSLRLARARELMRQTAMSVTEAAVATGFASPSHFSRAYKARFGAPPSAERARDHGMR